MTAHPSDSTPSLPPRGRAPGSPVFLIVVAAGIIGGLLTWAAGEATTNWFSAMSAGDPSGGPLAGGVVTNETADAAMLKNGTLTYAVQGGILGLIFGLAGGLIARSPRHGTVAGLEGVVLGLILVGAVAYGLFSVFFRKFDRLSDDFLLPILTHGGVWAIAGGVAGLAFGIGSGAARARILRATIGGLAGAALGAVLYEVLGAVFFPSSETNLPIASAAPARLLAHGTVALLAAVGIALAVANTRPARAS